MPSTLAIMFTLTTYGTWLRGDIRGWVDDGVVLPPDPILEIQDQLRMKHSRFLFAPADRMRVGQAMGVSLRERLGVRILAMSVQSWHVHIVIAATAHPVPQVVKCAKDAVRWELRVGRPVWGTDYDKRYCFDMAAVRARVRYVERHNLEDGLTARPWGFIEEWQG